MRVVVIGAGIGGMAATIELARHGFEEITLLERDTALGGTWHQNTYPGAACDVPSHLYSFSYAQRGDWSRICSPQQEILDYLHEVADHHDVRRRVVPNTDVTACAWDDRRALWTVSSADGRSWEAEAVIVATGQLHQPAFPSIPGRELFAGHAFHSARWDHDYDLRGKRVAVVGTGASAVQFVPEIAPRVRQLTVFQRTGNWFLPRKNHAYPGPLKNVFQRFPAIQRFRRRFLYHYGESLTLLIRNPETYGRIGHMRSAMFMRSQLKDPDVRAKAWPDYTFGCKRVLFSSYFLPALQRPNVELVTEPITQITSRGISTGDGTTREVDCIIYGTGFKTNDFMFPMRITGAAGVELRDVWEGGAHAHRGICVPGFPSMFVMYGPNTNTSGGSIILYEEAQAAYIRQALQHVRRRRAAAVDVRAEAEAAYDRDTQAAFEGTAWQRCDSWYRDSEGRIVANWPRYMRDYEESVRMLDPSEFVFIPQPEPAPAGPDLTPANADPGPGVSARR
jgi:cation diffusion facilitator CzcD-associated flavoprotein CzcO